MRPPAPDPRAARALDLTRIAAYGIAASCIGWCALCELWFVRAEQSVGFDEGYIGALALRLLDGGMLPGVDGVGQRGPVFYWATTLAQALFGRYQWTGLRVLGCIDACAVVLALVVLGELVRKPLAGALGAAFFVFFMFHVLDVGAGVAVNGEHLVAPLLCWSTALTGLSLRAVQPRRRSAHAVGAGLLAGLAGWTKITMFVGIAPLALWVLADSVRIGGRSRREHALALLPLLAGWLAPSVAIVAVYGAASALDELVYCFFTYNRDVYMGVYADVPLLPELARWLYADAPNAWTALAAALGLVAHLAYLAPRARAGGATAALSAVDLTTVVLLQAVVGYAAGIAQMRFWQHHFVTGLPWAGFALGLALDAGLQRVRAPARPLASFALALAVTAGLFLSVGHDVRTRERQRRAGGFRPARSDKICRAVRRWSQPDDSMFVWGFDSDLNVSCARRPASRYVMSTLIAGIVPPVWDRARPERVARAAPERLLLDLQRTRPALILDVPSKVAGIHVAAAPGMRSLLAQNYCWLDRIVGRNGRKVIFYSRLDKGFCPAKPRRAARR